MTDFYTDKNVLVIGGAGFLGVHLVRELLSAGAHVTVMDNFSRGQNIVKGAQYLRGDCAYKTGYYKRSITQQDVVFNLAATVAGVQWNQKHHLEAFLGNYAVQATPLAVASEYNIPHFLHVSSVCVYAPEHNYPCVEENGFLGEPVAANLGYALAKRMGERLAMWYHQERGLNVVRVRLSNLMGPNDYFDDKAHVIPALIKKCIHDDVINVYGTGDEVREFLYVKDAARGLMDAMAEGTPGDVYNIGTNGTTAISIQGVLLYIRRLTNALDKPLVFLDKNSDVDPGDAARWSDCTKAYNELNWLTERSLFTGLEETVTWYKETLCKTT